MGSAQVITNEQRKGKTTLHTFPILNTADLTLHKDKEMMNMVEILRVAFPALMVTGAAGSLITNIATKGDWPVSLQWLGACLLYPALLFRHR